MISHDDKLSTSEGDGPLVEIVMSVYNGAPWLDEMLASIERQDYPNWRLIVRDDGSTDDTLQILRRWAQRSQGRARVLGGENLGICASLSVATKETSASYVMFADADDVWSDCKIRMSLETLIEEEHSLGCSLPIAVYTDMTVINGDGDMMHESLWRFLGKDMIKSRPFNRVVIDSWITGPTIIANRSLIDVMWPIPAHVRAFDWWIAVVVAAFGMAKGLPVQTMKYRRHEKNDSVMIGETPLIERLGAAFKTLINPVQMRQRVYELLYHGQVIAGVFLERYRENLDDKEVAALQFLLDLDRLPFWKRKYGILRWGFWFDSTLVNLGFFVLV